MNDPYVNTVCVIVTNISLDAYYIAELDYTLNSAATVNLSQFSRYYDNHNQALMDFHINQDSSLYKGYMSGKISYELKIGDLPDDNKSE